MPAATAPEEPRKILFGKCKYLLFTVAGKQGKE